MNQRIESLLNQMNQLESEFHNELKACEVRFQRQIRFATSMASLKRGKDDNKHSGISLMQTLRHIASAPFIYSMIVPLVFFDISVSIYQAICFRLYGIPRVKRSEHMVIDRHYLKNLNLLDRFNCVFCGYGNGVISYAREIISKTEQYWCPIKHAEKLKSSSQRYNKFLEYGETENYHENMERYREQARLDAKEN